MGRCGVGLRMICIEWGQVRAIVEFASGNVVVKTYKDRQSSTTRVLFLISMPASLPLASHLLLLPCHPWSLTHIHFLCFLGRDRHENIGRGLIGIDCFKRVMNDPRLADIPLIMETPMQCAGPKINYPVSLRDSCLAFQETEQETGVCTDKRDIELLYTLCK